MPRSDLFLSNQRTDRCISQQCRLPVEVCPADPYAILVGTRCSLYFMFCMAFDRQPQNPCRVHMLAAKAAPGATANNCLSLKHSTLSERRAHAMSLCRLLHPLPLDYGYQLNANLTSSQHKTQRKITLSALLSHIPQSDGADAKCCVPIVQHGTSTASTQKAAALGHRCRGERAIDTAVLVYDQ